MKEATGGALLMGLAAGIIIIFIIVAAFFISYGKSFKMKNQIINHIEQNEGITMDVFTDFMVRRETAYHGDADVCYDLICNNGALRCSGESLRGFTLSVTVYMQMDRTILGDAFNIRIPVRGETRIIESGNYYDQLVANRNPFGSIKMCS